MLAAETDIIYVCLLYRYLDLLSANLPNKNSISLMRSNRVGHTIFLTSKKYRMTNHNPDTIFFTSEKIRIGFSRHSGQPCEVIESECLERSLISQNHRSEKDPVAVYKLYAKKRPREKKDNDPPF